MSMFCYQCEQTSKGTACVGPMGVCGKDEETALLQDVLLHAVKGLSVYAHGARRQGRIDEEINVFTLEAIFSTVTNVNFDPERVSGLIRKADEITQKAKRIYMEACVGNGETPELRGCPVSYDPTTTQSDFVGLAEGLTIDKRQAERGADAAGLEELLVYGIKGLAAYADHAQILGYSDDSVYGFIHEALSFILQPRTIDELLPLVIKAGAINLTAMELLDAANTETFGHPEPTQVRTEPVSGKAILVSGHDLKDLKALLEQTEGKGVNVYTHGEMLPAHGYPELKKHDHLKGNYGSAWQNQRREFASFPGAILMTTNCIQKPEEVYTDRIFTSGLVAWPGLRHIADRDFTPVIEAAIANPGFAKDGASTEITVGFARNAVLSVAGQVVDAVKSGAIKHFFLVGGCDGAKGDRSYFTDFAAAVPKDCVVLTLGCGKYRFNNLEFGDIGGIPRLLDIGQCNDSYSAIQIAAALAEAFDTDVNGLPLSLVLSWYEQKAVAVLLSLLSLGVKNIRLGPSLPAFVTPAVLNVLVDTFGIAPITTVEQDMSLLLS